MEHTIRKTKPTFFSIQALVLVLAMTGAASRVTAQAEPARQ